MIVWVVGGSGKIGSALSDKLATQGHRVIGIGRGVNEGYSAGEWISWDPSRLAEPRCPIPDPEIVFYLAGQTSSSLARERVDEDIEANVVALVRVISTSVRKGSKPHVIAAGAATEATLDHQGLAKHGSTDALSTFYETGKAAQRLYLAQFAREGLIDFTVLRLSNVYGGFSSSAPDRGFLDRCISSACTGEPIRFFGDAPYSRDYLFLEDAVGAFVSAAEHRNKIRNMTFDIGTGRTTPISKVLQKLQEIVLKRLGIEVDLQSVSSPASLHAVDAIDRAVDSTSFKETTGWNANFKLSKGLEKAVTSCAQRSSAQSQLDKRIKNSSIVRM